jgi:hypothetical protein
VKKSENKKSGKNKQKENQKREKRAQESKPGTVRIPDFFYKSIIG